MDREPDESEYAAARQRMVESQLRSRGIRDQRVLDAMYRTPRHVFVAPEHAEHAYDDGPLPTQSGQTISQPYIVARMTELLEVQPGMRVLEIGTGSGYQTAILAALGGNIVSVERIGVLVDQAERTLRKLGVLDRVRLIEGDGSEAVPDEPPFDRVLVTAGTPRISDAWKSQLADGGRIVAPVGDREHQDMVVVDRVGEQWTTRKDLRCRFVPLIGRFGWAAT